MKKQKLTATVSITYLKDLKRKLRKNLQRSQLNLVQMPSFLKLNTCIITQSLYQVPL